MSYAFFFCCTKFQCIEIFRFPFVFLKSAYFHKLILFLEIEKLLNQALDKIPSSPGTYYRGIGKDEIAILDKLKIGDDLPYKNFISTSSEREKALEFYYNNLKKNWRRCYD